MSRIAAITVSSTGAPVDEWLAGSLAAARQEGWSTATSALTGAALGWTGWRQPGVAEVDGVMVALDGFVYNRASFGSAHSDAELILRLYQTHGLAGALEQMNGDFALAVYDARERRLSLARDRFGFKPLYYAQNGDVVACASRPKSLLAVPGIRRDLHPQFVAMFAAFHYRCFDNEVDRSPYEHICQVPAGHIVSFQGGAMMSSPYWSLVERPDFDAGEEELAEAYRELLIDSVRLRLGGVERPAFTLSGGMDSSSVLSSAVRVLGGKQTAYSVVYDDKAYDESAEIETMLDSAVSDWRRVSIGTPDIPALVAEMVAAHDEPVATATWLSHHLLCGRARQDGIDALFGGLGGDELNAGEYEYFFFFFADLAAAGDDIRLAHETEKWVEYHDHPIFRKSVGVMQDGLRRLVDLQRPGVNRPDEVRLRRYQHVLNPDYFDLSAFEPVMDRPFSSYLKNRTYQDLFRETAPCCLRAEDRQTTQHGLGHFLPFLDHRLVEFMFRVPGTMKFRAGVTKHLLRQATRGLLPEDTRTRIKKTGWNAPAHVWFSGPGADHLRDIVRSQRFRQRGLYRPDAVMTIIDAHEDIIRTGRAEDNHMMFLWQLLNLDTWLTQLEAGRG